MILTSKLLLVLGGLALGLLVAEIVLGVMGLGFSMVETGQINQYDPYLGWDLIPNTRAEVKTSEYQVTYAINANGFRGDEDIERAKKNKRVAILGDSFAFGAGVENAKTFAKVLEQKNGCEVLNLGVPGYSPGQYLLRFESQGLPMNPDAVVMAIYTGNDIYDTETAAKPGMDKPFFLPGANNDKLVLQGVPVPKDEPRLFRDSLSRIFKLKTIVLVKNFLKRDSYPLWAKFPALFQTADNYERNMQILGMILKKTETELFSLTGERRFVVLIIPSSTVRHDHVEQGLISQLLRMLEEKNMQYVNLLSHILDQTGLYYKYDGHLTETGHSLAAEKLYEKIGFSCSET